MGDRPTAAELVAAVHDWIVEELQPQLDGRLAFHARVAANALAIAARELGSTGVAPDAAARASALLGRDVSPGAVDAELAQAIRAGVLRADEPEVLAVVRATVRAKLEIANPGYLAQGSG